MTVSPSVRFETLSRCNFACYYCGLPGQIVGLHVEHVMPRALGGTDDPWNLVAACPSCNGGKGATCPSPELVRSARDLWVISSERGRLIGRCYICAIPIVVDHTDDDEREAEERPQCSRCNEAICEAYDAGVRDAQRRSEAL